MESHVTLEDPNLQIKRLFDPKMISTFEKEEDEMVPYAIREEIISRVMDEITEIYLKKQALNFMLDCSYEALKKFLTIEFYFHHETEPFYEKHPMWAPDEPMKPSEPDTWAAHKVPVKEPEKVTEEPCKNEEVSSVERKSLLSKTETAISFVETDLDPPVFDPLEYTNRKLNVSECTGLDVSIEDNSVFQEDILKYLMDDSNITAQEEEEMIIKKSPKENLLQQKSKKYGTDKILEDLLKDVDNQTEGSEKSFIKFAKTKQSTKKCRLTANIHEEKHVKKCLLPKIRIPANTKSTKDKEYMTSLPKIRVETTYNSQRKATKEEISNNPKK